MNQHAGETHIKQLICSPSGGKESNLSAPLCITGIFVPPEEVKHHIKMICELTESQLTCILFVILQQLHLVV